jgi:SSS family solute:Na+ symporter
MFWKIFIIVVFFGISIVIGFLYRKKAATTADFVLGGRNVGPWLSAFAYGTTYFSATIFVGYSGQFGWSFGISSLWIGLGNAIIGSFLAWTILGRRTRILTKHLGAATMPDFFAKRYGSTAIKVAASVIIFIFLVPYTSSVYKGLSGLFAISFGIDFTYCIIGMAVLTGIFVIVGGYMGTAVNNVFQGIIMIAGIIMILVSVLNGKGGFTEAINELSKIPNEAAPNLNGSFASMFGPDPLGLLSVVILTSLGTLGLPQMVHKFYAVKDEKSIKAGTFISTIFAIIIAGGSYFMGGFGRLYYSAEKPVVDEIVPTMISKALPDILVGVCLLVVISASISTLASLVLTSSSTFISDFMKTFTKKSLNDKKEVVLIRAMCVVFIAVSVIIALIPTNLITSLMGLSWGALAGSFLGPFMYGLFWKKTTKAAVWSSMIVAIGIILTNFFSPFTTPTIAGAAAMLISLVIVPLVSFITPKPDIKTVETMFKVYDEKITVHKVDVLKEDGES